MHNHGDHSGMTHTAKCDDCEYLAKVHAHDEESAALMLSQDLAIHNKSEHKVDTDPENIKEAVKAKMKSTS